MPAQSGIAKQAEADKEMVDLMQKVNQQYEEYVRLNEVSDLAAYLNELNDEFSRLGKKQIQAGVASQPLGGDANYF